VDALLWADGATAIAFPAVIATIGLTSAA